ncbi:MAG: class I SAM-dependent methyltransferase [Gemmatimonas sp.]
MGERNAFRPLRRMFLTSDARSNRFARRIRRIVRDPVEAYYDAIALWHERNEYKRPPCTYRVDLDWRQRLCGTEDDHRWTIRLWADIAATLRSKGIDPGPESYRGWNDADLALAEAIRCLIRRVGAAKVVETGVAHGVTSRVVLEALNGRGHLWSIDYPPPDAPELHGDIGAAVGAEARGQWTLIFGSSQRRLPRLLRSIAPIDLFIHDSDHREFNTLFEMQLAWRALRPGGAMVVDDIDNSWAFHDFAETANAAALVAEAEPVRPDLRRFNEKGLFGVLLKPV